MVEISTKLIAQRIAEEIDTISCEVEDSCYNALSHALDIEDNKTTKFALSVMKSTSFLPMPLRLYSFLTISRET